MKCKSRRGIVFFIFIFSLLTMMVTDIIFRQFRLTDLKRKKRWSLVFLSIGDIIQISFLSYL